jgi:hypothetical protein
MTLKNTIEPVLTLHSIEKEVIEKWENEPATEKEPEDDDDDGDQGE